MTTGQAGYRSTQYSVGQMLLDPSSTSTAPSISQPESHTHIRSHANHPRHRDDHDDVVEGQVPMIVATDLLRDDDDRSTSPSVPASDRPLARLETPFLVPTTDEEERGQVGLVVFAEGLVQFKGRWFLYYGQADETLGVAVADVQP